MSGVRRPWGDRVISDLRAPFPYFGGKSTVANVVWAALGQPKHYLEPFFGSGAVLLARPDYRPDKHMETICDADGYICNVWRALQLDPDAVAKVCDWPVNHADLNARRKYLLQNADLLKQLTDDPEYYDVTMAGYWIWAASCWIGSGLTRPASMPEVSQNKGVNGKKIAGQRPSVAPSAQEGIHKISIVDKRPHIPPHGTGKGCQKQSVYDPEQYPDRCGQKGVHKNSLGGQRPEVHPDGYKGVHRTAVIGGRPQVGVQEGMGINQQIPLLNHEAGVCRRPCYGANGAHGVHKTTLTAEPEPLLDVRDPYTPGLYVWFRQLSERLRRVRVVCGDWSRICGGDWQDDRGTCGIFFDPPYSAKAGRDPSIYHEESLTVANDVREWCRKRADRKTYRIVLAGYYEEHESLLEEGWTVHRWSANGGFANKAKDKKKCKGEENRHREALFFSPHCHSSGLKRFCEVPA